MKEVRECPICDWKHEAEPPKVPPEALASVFGPGVMSMVAMQQHAQDIERALDAHFRTHSTLDWVRATVRLRDKNAALAKELRATDEAMGDYTVNIIRSLPEAAAKLRAEVERLAREVSDYRDYFDASEPDTRRWASGNARTETLRQARAAIMSRRIDRDRDADPTGESL